MIALLTAVALAQDPTLAGGNALEGYRVAQVGHGTGVGIYNEFVVGTDGGTNATFLVGRYGAESWGVSAAIPFAAHRTPLDRAVSLGNLQLAGWYRLPSESLQHAIGLELTSTLGGTGYTWVNDADALWPGFGADAFWQGQLQPSEKLAVLLRGELGLHGGRAYDPFPGLWLRVGAAGAVDYQVIDRLGLVGEMSITYWDLSPWETTLLARVDLIEGLRARAGVVLPMAVWAGWTPTVRPGGVRELTLLFDVTMQF